MAIECGVITAILLGMAVFFFVRKHKEWAWATIPLTFVPFADFVMVLVLVRWLHVSISLYWGVFVLLCAVAVSCACIGFVSNYLKSNSTRITYIIIGNLFNVLLAAILTSNILETVKAYGEMLH